MSSSPPAPGADEVEVGPPRLLHAAETGAGGDGGALLSSNNEAAGSDGGEEGDDVDEDEDDDGGDDNGTEVGEEEEDTDYTSDYSPEFYEEQLAADLEEVDRVLENMEENPPVASCCVCMEPWTSDGAHCICCIPCGHVHGRSCLEKWLRRCGGNRAKCPQCGESFEQTRIINLYSTEYLWNDCIHVQELERLMSLTFDRVKETERKSLKWQESTRALGRRSCVMERMVGRINEEMIEFRGEVLLLMEKMNKMIISKDGEDTATAALTPDRMLKFLSRNWPKLPRSHRP